MAADYENMAKAIISTPKGARIIKGLDKISDICRSESGRQLMGMLAGGGSDIIKTAAQAAQSNTREPARAFISSFLSTKEGTALASKIIELAGI